MEYGFGRFEVAAADGDVESGLFAFRRCVWVGSLLEEVGYECFLFAKDGLVQGRVAAASGAVEDFRIVGDVAVEVV